MSDLAAKMESAQISKVAAAQFAPKKPPGTKGTKIGIQTNCAKMELKPNQPYFKYDVTITAKITKKDGSVVEKDITKMNRDDSTQQMLRSSCVTVFKAALAASGKMFDANTTFYDRSKSLFSMKKLDLGGAEKVIKVKTEVPDCDLSDWEFKIKQCADSFQVTTNDLAKVVNSNVSMQDRTLLEALNLICSKAALLNSDDFVTYGTGTHYLIDPKKWGFKDTDLKQLPDGKQMMIAVAKKVSVLEGEDKKPTAYLTTEIKKSSVHNSEPLGKKIQSYLMMNKQFTAEAVRSKMRQLKDLLKGLAVYPQYATSQVFNIIKLTESTPRTYSFDVKGKRMTVEQYFKNQKKITLKHPDMPMAVGYFKGQEVPYPMEILIVAPHQRVTNSQTTPDEMKDAIRASATVPQERYRQTEMMKKAMRLNSTNQDLVQAGIKVSDNMAVVQGRVLPDPELVYSNNAVIRPAGHCKWNSNAVKFNRPAVVPKWWLIANLANNERCGVDMVEAFGQKIVAEARKRGMTIADKVIKVIHPSIGGVDEIFAQARNENIPYLLFVSTDNLKFHDHIKRLEVETQILTQEVRVSNAMKVAHGPGANTMENIVNKINEKNGGLGFSVKMTADSWLMDKTKIFIGLEMSHPAPLSAAEQRRGVTYNTPSVLGFAANCAAHPHQYIGDYLFVEPRKTDPMGEKIAEIIPRILKDMRQNRDAPPKHIVIYFHGVSEGQYGEIATTYKTYLRKGLDALSVNFKPLVTLIAVSKDHCERFYNQKITGTKAAEQNISPGTVVDQVVVNPTINEFYLTSHSAFQGTAKSPKYTVVYDDSNASMDLIEGATHGLCFLHEIVTATVSLPAPLIVADRCAKRGAKVFHDAHHTTAGELNLPLLNETLTNNGKRLSKVRYNA